MRKSLRTADLSVRALKVKSVRTDSLKPNPHNPRYLFDRADLDVLRESISKVGVLVPLTVYKESRSGDYVILDGQRRWICAQELKLLNVPVNEVAEPTLVQNIVTMFQIHKLRKDWELMPTALKIDLLMTELKERNPNRIAKLTSMQPAVVVRCKKLLSYNLRYQDMMLDLNPAARVKADFFIELYPVRMDRLVNTFDWYERDPFTDTMLWKYSNKVLRSVTEFRTIKQHISNAARARKISQISKRLREFTERRELTSDHLDIESAQVAATARKIQESASKLHQQIAAIEIEQFYGEESMWNTLAALAGNIRSKMRKLGRREIE
jgi:ParB/RepB/Spo0J family partition protein